MLSARFALVLALAAVPAHADDALRDRGAALFLNLCARCHGPEARDGASGDIRAMPRASVARAVRGVEQMPRFELTDDAVTAISYWLASLD
jgi:mono/diheme cytochrome c family protein